MPRKAYYTGIVIENEDPEMRGRLQIECPEIVHGETMAEWIEPTFHFVDSSQRAGSIWIPNIDSEVTVEIEDEEDSEVTSLEPKWRCDIYPDDTVPEVFQTNYPQRRGWVTAAGHVMYFDDTESEIEFRYEHPSGAYIQINNSGQVIIEPASGQGVKIGDGATEAMLLGDTVLDWVQSFITNRYNTHTHADPVSGNTGVPNTLSVTPTNEWLSDDNKVE